MPDDSSHSLAPFNQGHSSVEPGTARASYRLAWGSLHLEADAEVHVTPRTLLAIGGMVGMILLGVVPIVAASRRRQR